MIINWASGKSITYDCVRGKTTTGEYQALKTLLGFGLKVPGTAHVISVMYCYKHLGSTTESCCSNMKFVTQSASSAMIAYCPMPAKVFGATYIDNTLKLHLYSSLAESWLLFNCHCRVFKVKELRKFSAAYTWVCRRIAGHMLYDGDGINDAAVPTLLNAPSIDCILLQRRLQYCGRLARSDCHALVSLLSLSFDRFDAFCMSLGISQVCGGVRARHGLVAKWMATVQDDYRLLYEYFIR